MSEGKRKRWPGRRKGRRKGDAARFSLTGREGSGYRVGHGSTSPQCCHDAELTAFVRWLTHTHTMRWHTHYHTMGTGHLYRGRFKSFPIESDDHLYRVLRYVQRNPLRAGLVREAENWRWSSLYRRQAEDRIGLLHRWPVPMPEDWLAQVHKPQSEAELEALRRSVARGCPYGNTAWQERTARRLGLEHTLRRPGRPKKGEQPSD